MGQSLTILIPAYNPDGKLIALLPKLRERFSRIILVDDGSTTGKEIFPAAAKYVEKILVHEKNRGKGAALKTGFKYIAETGGGDVITADADGQHTPGDIAKVADGLSTHRDGLVLGVRSFSGKVPFRSRFGNFWTRTFFFLMTGLRVRDTQTGLRGIPAGLLSRVASIPGERYEYEMAMLADAKHHPSRPLEIPIETVYIDENATSHFNPLLDSIRIYRSLFSFCLTSILGFLLDNGVFALSMWLLARGGMVRRDSLLVSFVIARFLSSHFNYFANRFLVFRPVKAPGAGHSSYFRYFALVLAILGCGYALTEGAACVLGLDGAVLTVVKIVCETFLFFVSYFFQKKFVFRSNGK